MPTSLPILPATSPTPASLAEPSSGTARDERPGLTGLDPGALDSWMAERGVPTFRARQVAADLWGRHVEDVEQIRTLPTDLRAALARDFRADTISETAVRAADEGLTEKALHRLSDGRSIESVLMRYPSRPGHRERATICISSQAGCAVGCPFCATGELGLERDLDAAEIVDQVRFWARRLSAEKRQVTNVVFMGMGEPLLNLEPVLRAAAALTDPRRFGLGARHVTISTSGVVPSIERMTVLRPQYTLAVSLHAARPALRDVLVPLNRRYPVGEVVAAAARYAGATGRRVSYEYVMISGINDTDADAAGLRELLATHRAHVNLIPMNPVAHTLWQPTPMPRIEDFAAELRAGGLTTTIRRNRGAEIGAACGQLAAEQAGRSALPAVQRRRDLLVRRSAAAMRQP